MELLLGGCVQSLAAFLSTNVSLISFQNDSMSNADSNSGFSSITDQNNIRKDETDHELSDGWDSGNDSPELDFEDGTEV